MAGASVVIAVGDEVLGGFIADTNSHLATRLLFAAGYPVRRIEVVADRPEEIAAAVARAVAETGVDRILVGGGVGPTPDDRTHEGVARALGRDLEVNPAALAHIEAIVARMHAAGWVESAAVSEPNRRMATVAAGARVLENRRGMAPPVAYDLGGDRWLFVLPGVPREFEAVLEEAVIPDFCGGGTAPTVRELRYPQAIEAEFAELLAEIGRAFPGVEAGSYPQSQRRELLIRLRGDDGAQVEAAEHWLRERRPGAG